MEDGPKRRTHWGADDETRKYGFVFNAQGFIDLAEIPDFSDLYYQAPIHVDKLISFEDLANASIVFRVAKNCGVEPGTLNCGDTKLRIELAYRLSQTFVDKQAEVKALLDSWRKVAKHPLALPYAGSFYPPASIRGMLYRTEGLASSLFKLPYFHSFELFLQSYMEGMVKVMAHTAQPSIPQYLKAMQWVHYNLQGQFFLDNELLQWPIINQYLQGYLDRDPECREVIGLKEKLSKVDLTSQTSSWMYHICAYINLDLEDVSEDFSDFRKELSLAMSYLCRGQSWREHVGPLLLDNKLSRNQSLANFMQALETIDELLACQTKRSKAHLEKFKSYFSAWIDQAKDPDLTLFKSGIIFACYELAQRIQLFCFHDEREPFLFVDVGQSIEQDRAIFDRLGEHLKDLAMYQLFDLAKKVKCSECKETLLAALSSRCELESQRHSMLVVRRFQPVTAIHADPMLSLCSSFMGLGLVAPKPWVKLFETLQRHANGEDTFGDVVLAKHIDSATDLVDYDKAKAQAKASSAWGFFGW